jgi:rhodanese-related sulfurtransferase
VEIKRIWDEIERLEPTLENLGIEDLKQELADTRDLLLVDIREIQERVLRGAIPGSKHVPRGMLEFWADPSLSYFRDFFDSKRRIVLYCAGGGRSALAAATLRDMGYPDVAHLAPGFDGWKAAGEEVEDVAATSRWVRRE